MRYVVGRYAMKLENVYDHSLVFVSKNKTKRCANCLFVHEKVFGKGKNGVKKI